MANEIKGEVLAFESEMSLRKAVAKAILKHYACKSWEEAPDAALYDYKGFLQSRTCPCLIGGEE